MKDFLAFLLTVTSIFSISIYSLNLINNLNVRKTNLDAFVSTYTSVMQCRNANDVPAYMLDSKCGKFPSPTEFNLPLQSSTQLPFQ